MFLRSILVVIFVTLLAAWHVVAMEATTDTSAVLRKLQAKEKLCDKEKTNFKSGAEKTLKSPQCGSNAILKKCDCTSDTKKVVVVDVSTNTNKGLCKCTFQNEANKKKKKVKISACAVCETPDDQCTTNSDCTEYLLPICNKDAVPKVCVQCKRDSQCGAGEVCRNNQCV